MKTMTRCTKHGYTYCCIHEDCIICCDLCRANREDGEDGLIADEDEFKQEVNSGHW